MAKKTSKKKPKMIVDVLSHVLVPKMVVLSEAEKTKLLKKYSISEDQLPVVPHTDPAAKALKAEQGNVIKITRKGDTGDYVAYRIVV